MRIDRFMHDLGKGSRKEIKRMIAQSRIQINGHACTKSSIQISPNDCVCLDGKRLIYNQHIYLAMHKPQDMVTAIKDSQDATVFSLLTAEDKLRKPNPVGRLDKDTTGLLLWSSNGELVHRLTSPKYHVAKTYRVVFEGQLPNGAKDRLNQGIMLNDGMTLPADLMVLNGSMADLTIYEGRFHQVKRMFKALGCEVTKLHRYQVGTIGLGELAYGTYRYLSESEIRSLEKLVGMV